MANGLYIGSFDCFSNGHLDVLEQAIPLYDKIFIVVGKNPNKKRRYTIESSVEYIRQIISTKPYANKIEVHDSIDIAPECAKRYKCEYLIRGLRNTSDFAYEENLIKLYQHFMPELKVTFFYTNKSYISSTAVDELVTRGEIEIVEKDFVPYKMDCLERVHQKCLLG